MNHIRDLGEADLIKHSQVMAKNANYMSHFTVDELTEVIMIKSRLNYYVIC